MIKNKKSFSSFWRQLKFKIIFEYTTLPYDPDKKSLKQVLLKNEEIEEIVLERSEAMWRNLFDEGFGMTRFFLDGVEILVRVWSHTNDCRIDLQSKEFQKECLKIEEIYFTPKFLPSRNRKQDYLVKDVLKNFKNSRTFDFKFSNQSFDIENIVDAIGGGLDPLIKNLVQILNQLGITTTASCQGHNDHGLQYPWINISMLDLPKFLAILNQISKKEFLEFKLESFKDDFRFFPPNNYSLKRGQLAFQKLANIILLKSVSLSI